MFKVDNRRNESERNIFLPDEVHTMVDTRQNPAEKVFVLVQLLLDDQVQAFSG